MNIFQRTILAVRVFFAVLFGMKSDLFTAVKEAFRTSTGFFKLDPAACGNVYSAQYTNMFVNSPPARVTPEYLGGRKRSLIGVYTQSGAGTIGDVVYFGKLPAGATVLRGLLSWTTGAASATLAVGIVGTAAKFLAATGITTAGDADCKAHMTAGLTPYKTTTETDVIGTNATAAIAASQQIVLYLEYVLD